MAAESDIPAEVSFQKAKDEDRTATSPAELIQYSHGFDKACEVVQSSEDEKKKCILNNVKVVTTGLVNTTSGTPEREASTEFPSLDNMPCQSCGSEIYVAEKIKNPVSVDIPEKEMPKREGAELGESETGSVKKEKIDELNEGVKGGHDRVSGTRNRSELAYNEETNLEDDEEEIVYKRIINDHLEATSSEGKSHKKIPQNMESDITSTEKGADGLIDEDNSINVECEKQVTGTEETDLDQKNKDLIRTFDFEPNNLSKEYEGILEGSSKENEAQHSDKLGSVAKQDEECKETSSEAVQIKELESSFIMVGKEDSNAISSTRKIGNEQDGEYELTHDRTENVSGLTTAESHDIPNNNAANTDGISEIGRITTCEENNQIIDKAGLKEKDLVTYEGMDNTEDSTGEKKHDKETAELKTSKINMIETADKSEVGSLKHNTDSEGSLLQIKQKSEKLEPVNAILEKAEIGSPSENDETNTCIRVEEQIEDSKEILEEKGKEDEANSISDISQSRISMEESLSRSDLVETCRSTEAGFINKDVNDLDTTVVEEREQGTEVETCEVPMLQSQVKIQESSAACTEKGKTESTLVASVSTKNIITEHTSIEEMDRMKEISKLSENTHNLENFGATGSDDISKEAKNQDDVTEKEKQITKDIMIEAENLTAEVSSIISTQHVMIQQGFQEESLTQTHSELRHEGRSSGSENHIKISNIINEVGNGPEIAKMDNTDKEETIKGSNEQTSKAPQDNKREENDIKKNSNIIDEVGNTNEIAGTKNTDEEVTIEGSNEETREAPEDNEEEHGKLKEDSSTDITREGNVSELPPEFEESQSHTLADNIKEEIYLKEETARTGDGIPCETTDNALGHKEVLHFSEMKQGDSVFAEHENLISKEDLGRKNAENKNIVSEEHLDGNNELASAQENDSNVTPKQEGQKETSQKEEQREEHDELQDIISKKTEADTNRKIPESTPDVEEKETILNVEDTPKTKEREEKVTTEHDKIENESTQQEVTKETEAEPSTTDKEKQDLGEKIVAEHDFESASKVEEQKMPEDGNKTTQLSEEVNVTSSESEEKTDTENVREEKKSETMVDCGEEKEDDNAEEEFQNRQSGEFRMSHDLKSENISSGAEDVEILDRREIRDSTDEEEVCILKANNNDREKAIQEQDVARNQCSSSSALALEESKLETEYHKDAEKPDNIKDSKLQTEKVQMKSTKTSGSGDIKEPVIGGNIAQREFHVPSVVEETESTAKVSCSEFREHTVECKDLGALDSKEASETFAENSSVISAVSEEKTGAVCPSKGDQIHVDSENISTTVATEKAFLKETIPEDEEHIKDSNAIPDKNRTKLIQNTDISEHQEEYPTEGHDKEAALKAAEEVLEKMDDLKEDKNTTAAVHNELTEEKASEIMEDQETPKGLRALASAEASETCTENSSLMFRVSEEKLGAISLRKDDKITSDSENILAALATEKASLKEDRLEEKGQTAHSNAVLDEKSTVIESTETCAEKIDHHVEDKYMTTTIQHELVEEKVWEIMEDLEPHKDLDGLVASTKASSETNTENFSVPSMVSDEKTAQVYFDDKITSGSESACAKLATEKANLKEARPEEREEITNSDVVPDKSLHMNERQEECPKEGDGTKEVQNVADKGVEKMDHFIEEKDTKAAINQELTEEEAHKDPEAHINLSALTSPEASETLAGNMSVTSTVSDENTRAVSYGKGDHITQDCGDVSAAVETENPSLKEARKEEKEHIPDSNIVPDERSDTIMESTNMNVRQKEDPAEGDDKMNSQKATDKGVEMDHHIEDKDTTTIIQHDLTEEKAMKSTEDLEVNEDLSTFASMETSETFNEKPGAISSGKDEEFTTDSENVSAAVTNEKPSLKETIPEEKEQIIDSNEVPDGKGMAITKSIHMDERQKEFSKEENDRKEALNVADEVVDKMDDHNEDKDTAIAIQHKLVEEEPLESTKDIQACKDPGAIISTDILETFVGNLSAASTVSIGKTEAVRFGKGDQITSHAEDVSAAVASKKAPTEEAKEEEIEHIIGSIASPDEKSTTIIESTNIIERQEEHTTEVDDKKNSQKAAGVKTMYIEDKDTTTAIQYDPTEEKVQETTEDVKAGKDLNVLTSTEALETFSFVPTVPEEKTEAVSFRKDDQITNDSEIVPATVETENACLEEAISEEEVQIQDSIVVPDEKGTTVAESIESNERQEIYPAEGDDRRKTQKAAEKGEEMNSNIEDKDTTTECKEVHNDTSGHASTGASNTFSENSTIASTVPEEKPEVVSFDKDDQITKTSENAYAAVATEKVVLEEAGPEGKEEIKDSNVVPDEMGTTITESADMNVRHEEYTTEGYGKIEAQKAANKGEERLDQPTEKASSGVAPIEETFDEGKALNNVATCGNRGALDSIVTEERKKSLAGKPELQSELAEREIVNDIVGKDHAYSRSDVLPDTLVTGEECSRYTEPGIEQLKGTDAALEDKDKPRKLQEEDTVEKEIVETKDEDGEKADKHIGCENPTAEVNHEKEATKMVAMVEKETIEQDAERSCHEPETSNTKSDEFIMEKDPEAAYPREEQNVALKSNAKDPVDEDDSQAKENNEKIMQWNSEDPKPIPGKNVHGEFEMKMEPEVPQDEKDKKNMGVVEEVHEGDGNVRKEITESQINSDELHMESAIHETIDQVKKYSPITTDHKVTELYEQAAKADPKIEEKEIKTEEDDSIVKSTTENFEAAMEESSMGEAQLIEKSLECIKPNEESLDTSESMSSPHAELDRNQVENVSSGTSDQKHVHTEGFQIESAHVEDLSADKIEDVKKDSAAVSESDQQTLREDEIDKKLLVKGPDKSKFKYSGAEAIPAEGTMVDQSTMAGQVQVHSPISIENHNMMNCDELTVSAIEDNAIKGREIANTMIDVPVKDAEVLQENEKGLKSKVDDCFNKSAIATGKAEAEKSSMREAQLSENQPEDITANEKCQETSKSDSSLQGEPNSQEVDCMHIDPENAEKKSSNARVLDANKIEESKTASVELSKYDEQSPDEIEGIQKTLTMEERDATIKITPELISEGAEPIPNDKITVDQSSTTGQVTESRVSIMEAPPDSAQGGMVHKVKEYSPINTKTERTTESNEQAAKFENNATKEREVSAAKALAEEKKKQNEVEVKSIEASVISSEFSEQSGTGEGQIIEKPLEGREVDRDLEFKSYEKEHIIATETRAVDCFGMITEATLEVVTEQSGTGEGQIIEKPLEGREVDTDLEFKSYEKEHIIATESQTESMKIAEAEKSSEEVFNRNTETSGKNFECLLETQSQKVLKEEDDIKEVQTNSKAEHNQSDETSKAKNIKGIMEEMEAKDSQVLSSGQENNKGLHDEAVKYPEKTNETSVTTNQDQHEMVTGRGTSTKIIEGQVTMGDISMEDETIKESLPDETEGRNATNALPGLSHQTQGNKTEFITEGTKVIPSGEKLNQVIEEVTSTQRTEKQIVVEDQTLQHGAIRESLQSGAAGNDAHAATIDKENEGSETIHVNTKDKKELLLKGSREEGTEGFAEISEATQDNKNLQDETFEEKLTLGKADAESLHCQTTGTNDVAEVIQEPEKQTNSIIDNTIGEQTELGEEKIVHLSNEATGKSIFDTDNTPLSDISQISTKETCHVSKGLNGEECPTVSNDNVKTEEAETSHLKTEKEKEEGKGEGEGEGADEQRKTDSPDGLVMVEASRDADTKVAHKKHNILSGVGSKVKHSISKVRKAITGKSSHPKVPPSE